MNSTDNEEGMNNNGGMFPGGGGMFPGGMGMNSNRPSIPNMPINPFGPMPNQPMNSNDSMKNEKVNKHPEESSMPTFDVDELVKKIDAKIAELEEEERKEQEEKNRQEIKEAKVEEITTNDKLPRILPSQVFDEKEITDDQFFDDFFCDEDE